MFYRQPGKSSNFHHNFTVKQQRVIFLQIIFNRFSCKNCGVEGDKRLLPQFCHMKAQKVHPGGFLERHPLGNYHLHWVKLAWAGTGQKNKRLFCYRDWVVRHYFPRNLNCSISKCDNLHPNVNLLDSLLGELFIVILVSYATSSLMKTEWLLACVEGKVGKNICKWCWCRLVANNPSIYCLKCLFWPQNLGGKWEPWAGWKFNEKIS